jgi:hypothetical protein
MTGLFLDRFDAHETPWHRLKGPPELVVSLLVFSFGKRKFPSGM